MTNKHHPIPQVTQGWATAYPESQERFDVMVRHFRTNAETMLREHFGVRCPDYEPGCECCRRWKLLDDLTANPYED